MADLTIKGYDVEERAFILGFPNREVERGFLNSLLPIYTRSTDCESMIRGTRSTPRVIPDPLNQMEGK